MPKSQLLRTNKQKFIAIIILTFLYLVFGKLGLSFAFIQPNASPIWPPTGLSIAALLLFGLSLWPGILLGAFLVNVFTAGAYFTSFGIAIGNTLEAVLAAYLVNRYANGIKAFDQVNNIFKFTLLAGFLSTIISPSFGVTSLALGDYVNWYNYWSVWLTWWLGDMGGALLFAPLLVLWCREPIFKWNKNRVIEALIFLTFLTVIGLGVIGDIFFPNYALTFIALPVIVWSSFRFDKKVTVFASFILSIYAVIGILLKNNFYIMGIGTVNEELLFMQSFICAITVSGLAMSAAVAEREANFKDLQDSQQKIADIVKKLELQYIVIKELAQTTDLDEGFNIIIKEMAIKFSWDFGALWLLNDDKVSLSCRICWSKEQYKDSSFYKDTLSRILHRDEDLPGRILQSQEPTWINILIEDLNSPRVSFARETGLQMGFGFPIISGSYGCTGVVEFFSSSMRKHEPDLMKIFSSLGSQLGLFLAKRLAQKNAEQALVQRAQELAEADRHKDEFIAMLGHELRNPLWVISSALELANRSKLPEKYKQAQAVIERQVKNLTRLVDDLLDVSRLTADCLQLQKMPVELNTLIKGIIETIKPLVEEKSHNLTLALPTYEIWVDADITRLEQIIINLLTNAIKYTNERGKIILSVTTFEQNLEISVKDNGIGISSDRVLQIFELFVRGEQNVNQSGLGIGLSLVKKLTEMHGGEVNAYSQGPGMGSEFKVKLPLALHVQSQEETQLTLNSEILISDNRRIMIVDDNFLAAKMLAEILKEAGYEIKLAKEGLEAIQMAPQFCPEIILLDIGLPDVDGLEVVRELRKIKKFKSILIIAISGYGQPEDYQRSREAGFDFHLVKPIRPEPLFKLISEFQSNSEELTNFS